MGEQEMTGKTVFATVGTTKFDLLVSTLTEELTLNALKQRGYDNIVIQTGKGTVLPSEENCRNMKVNLLHYSFKDSIDEDIESADLVISHAGAGTCLEVLGAEKPLIVVVNEELMDNHQTELADQFSSEKYLLSCTCTSLVETITGMNLNTLKKRPLPEPNLLANYLNEITAPLLKIKKLT